MMAFILAGIVLIVGALGFFLSIALYMSMDAPSVQGDASLPWVWLIGGIILAALIAGSHFLPPVGW